MMDTLIHWDELLFLWLNGLHSAQGDVIMWYVSKMWLWTPVYAWMLYSLFSQKPRVHAFIALICIAFLLFLTDFLAVKLVKETVMRLRPTHNTQLDGLVHMVRDELGNYYRGGRYGFFSNHASNFSGVATFFFLIMRPMKRSQIAFLALWVMLIGYSRIYLGVHYPFDVLAGFIYGSIAGLSMHWVFLKFTKKTVAL
ncbi:MAG: phosphatase PAP2 family protein [Flavobacteriales bacterium]|jgi:undecaprenyl-diphosphatase